jgi:hypothetical protein
MFGWGPLAQLTTDGPILLTTAHLPTSRSPCAAAAGSLLSQIEGGFGSGGNGGPGSGVGVGGVGSGPGGPGGPGVGPGIGGAGLGGPGEGKESVATS